MLFLVCGCHCYRVKFRMGMYGSISPKSHLKKPHVSHQKKSIDWALFLVVGALTIFGLLMVYEVSAVSALQSFGDRYYFIRQQVIWVVLGFLALIFFSLFDYHRFEQLAWPLFGASFLLLLMVFVPGLGVEAGGAHRWLKVAGFTVQPTEVIKLMSIIFLSSLFKTRAKFLPFLIMFIGVSLVMGLFQRDLGSAVVFVLITLGVYFIAGAPLRFFLALLPVIFLGAVLFVVKFPYRLERVLAFLEPFADPQGFSYHISQILIALGSGGWWGVGLGQSRQKFAYIPEVTTDSIFAIVGEEMGFLGACVVVALIAFLIIKGISIAERAPDNFGKILAGGLSVWLGVQSIVNLGAMVSLIPLTGVPLPFISYGGSALLVNLVAVGILLNISRQTVLRSST